MLETKNCQGLGNVGMGGLLLCGYRVLIGEDEKFWRGMVATVTQ